MLLSLQIGIAPHQCQGGSARGAAALPGCQQHVPAVKRQVMCDYGCTELRFQGISCQALAWGNDPQQLAVSAGQWQWLLASIDQ